MKHLLLFLCLLSAPLFAGDCAIEIIGADIPMCDGAVQVQVQKLKTTPIGKDWSRDGLLFEFLPENYAENPGGTARWTNTGSYGGYASQSVEVYKPTRTPTNANAFTPPGLPDPPFTNQVCFFTNAQANLLDIAVSTDIPRPGTWVLVGRFGRVYIVHGSGTGNQSRLDYRGSLRYTYYDGSGISFYTETKFGVFTKVQDSAGVHTMYKDGVQEDQKTGAIHTVYAPRLTLGDAAGTTPTAGFRGHINALLIYNRALSYDEVLAVEEALRAYIGTRNIEGKQYAEEW